MNVWKIPLSLSNTQPIACNRPFKPLHVAWQPEPGVMEGHNSSLCLWVEADPLAEKIERTIRIIGTGHDFEPAGWTYIGTVHSREGAENLVLHVYIDGDTP